MENSKNILIVEDEIIIALQLKSDLLEMGHAITAICPSGEKAIESIKTTRPDIVLMDITLKGKMDGIETAHQIKEQYSIPTVFLTAHSEETIIGRAKITEPYGYLLKPINLKNLQIVLEVALFKFELDKEKAQLTKDLQKALEKVKLLSGIIPMCCSCKKIRNDKGFWELVEVYIRDHSEATISHGLCEECSQELYPKFCQKTEKGE